MTTFISVRRKDCLGEILLNTDTIASVELYSEATKELAPNGKPKRAYFLRISFRDEQPDLFAQCDGSLFDLETKLTSSYVPANSGWERLQLMVDGDKPEFFRDPIVAWQISQGGKITEPVCLDTPCSGTVYIRSPDGRVFSPCDTQWNSEADALVELAKEKAA